MKCPVCDGIDTFVYHEYLSGDGDCKCSRCGQYDLSEETITFEIIGDILRAREAHQAKQKEPTHDPH